ncbi:hypothetical protein, partial [Aeromonas veronii]|uniref:hypothetical protein n=1 Tax=Aeromonas veronii TaxID=654 RepID=UPI003BA1C056
MKITTGYPLFTAQYPNRQESLEWISPENNIRGSNAARPHQGVVAQINEQVMTSPAPGYRYTRGFL